MRIGEVQEEVLELIARATIIAMSSEESERKTGKILTDNPVARLVISPIELEKTFFLVRNVFGNCLFDETEMIFERHGSIFSRAVLTTVTTYLQSRRMWGAYKPAVAVLKSHGIEDEALLYHWFHYVPGVMVFLQNGGRILLGVRSARLAGTHSGMISFPAGLVSPNERLITTARRELCEESGLCSVMWPTGVFAPVRNPDAPSTTFCIMARTDEEVVRETFEAKGKKFIWVSITEVLCPALHGDMRPMVQAFAKHDIEIGEATKIAPDALGGLNVFGFGG